MIVIPIIRVNKRAEDKFGGQNNAIDDYNEVLASGLDRYSEFLDVPELMDNNANKEYFPRFKDIELEEEINLSQTS